MEEIFVQTFLGGGGFNPHNLPSEYGPVGPYSMPALSWSPGVVTWKAYCHSVRDIVAKEYI